MIHRRQLAGGTMFEIVRGDITQETTDAIVNAANARLAGGGGVDGAIHRAGGPGIMAECRKIGRCPTGFAVVTTAGKLKTKWVIHTVGPIYSGLPDDPKQLASAYRSSLQRAAEKKVESIAFPSISTGAYGYPIDKACPIALTTCIDFVRQNSTIKLVRFILFSDADYAMYVNTLNRMKD